MLGREPRLRQPPFAEQLAQPLGVRAIGLGAALAAAQRAGLHRLGQVRHRPGPLQAPADKQPARARLNRDMDLPARETIHPLLNGSLGGLELTAPHLTGHGVQRVKRDLPTMHIKPGDDRARSNAEHKRGAQHRLRGVTPDRCHTVIHGRYLQLRMTGGAAATAHAFNQRRSTRRTGHLPPGLPRRYEPGCSCHLCASKTLEPGAWFATNTIVG